MIRRCIFNDFLASLWARSEHICIHLRKLWRKNESKQKISFSVSKRVLCSKLNFDIESCVNHAEKERERGSWKQNRETVKIKLRGISFQVHSSQDIWVNICYDYENTLEPRNEWIESEKKDNNVVYRGNVFFFCGENGNERARSSSAKESLISFNSEQLKHSLESLKQLFCLWKRTYSSKRAYLTSKISNSSATAVQWIT